jgi:hypothetical protein
MTDKTTKLLLAAIALGLWANLALPLLPTAARARASSSGDMSNMASSLAEMQGDLDSIAMGTCRNGMIC